jgi:hypothetical protein
VIITTRACPVPTHPTGAGSKPSTVAFAPDPFIYLDPLVGAVEMFGEGPAARVEAGLRARPRLLSLRGVDVARLTLSELDLGCLPVPGRPPFGPAPDRGDTALCLHPNRLEVRPHRRAGCPGVAVDPTTIPGRRAPLARWPKVAAGPQRSASPAAGWLVWVGSAGAGVACWSKRAATPAAPTRPYRGPVPGPSQGTGGQQRRAGGGRLLLRRDGDAPACLRDAVG